jgi:adsorption protein B
VWWGHCAAICVALIAVWILISALDDLFIALIFLFRKPPPFPWPADSELAAASERRIAILVPLWQEHEVIRQMLRHNLSVIRYGNYDIFVGLYPNDLRTREAVEEVVRQDARVHIVLCPHDGPTSKGDCLNWTFKSMVEYETRRGLDFDAVVTHDAEDLIHPDSLRLINWFSRDYQMIQVPVLPLPTGLNDWTHGIYCDEFAEFQSKDIPVRHQLGGFLPANGVGTGFERSALESLRRQYNGKIFDPACLTEDYENGFRIHAAGYRQIFIPLRGRVPVATREFFPRKWRAAVRQRSRWIAGIALQGWELHGWRVPARQIYWFWRDRKGLVGNLLSPFANLLFFSWLITHLAPAMQGFQPDGFVPALLLPLCTLSAGLSLLQVGLRAYFTIPIYGLRFATAAPLRTFWCNWINFCATVQALRQFLNARAQRRTLAWRKTDHVYPIETITSSPRLGEALVAVQGISSDLSEQPPFTEPRLAENETRNAESLRPQRSPRLTEPA